MKDKNFTKLLFVALAAAFLYWVWLRRQAAQTASSAPQAPVMTSNDPQALTYAANPAAYQPQSLGTITIANQGLSSLSNQYTPLFGFVGMAQGVAYQ